VKRQYNTRPHKTENKTKTVHMKNEHRAANKNSKRPTKVTNKGMKDEGEMRADGRSATEDKTAQRKN
jgi:hypothetical protein